MGFKVTPGRARRRGSTERTRAASAGRDSLALEHVLSVDTAAYIYLHLHTYTHAGYVGTSTVFVLGVRVH